MMDTKTAAALGIFDGVHLGHRAVLAAAAEQKKNGLSPNVFTFAPKTAAIKGASGFIYSDSEKKFILESECGMEGVFTAEFSELCGLDGRTFVSDILVDRLNAGFVSCGRNFRFGKDASCGVDELVRFGKEYGFEVCAVDDVACNGQIVSSTAIRELLLEGNVEKAAELLGEPYMLFSEVVHGAALGRTIGFPTANQIFAEGQLVPKYGVYKSVTSVDGRNFRSMTNIGTKPTVNSDGRPLSETYIDGFSGDIYGRKIQVKLIEYIRPEMKFASVSELEKQIAQDVRTAVKR